MKNVSSSGKIIQSVSEDEGILKSWKFYMSSVTRHWPVMGVLGDFPFLLVCRLEKMMTTAASGLGVLCWYCL